MVWLGVLVLIMLIGFVVTDHRDYKVHKEMESKAEVIGLMQAEVAVEVDLPCGESECGFAEWYATPPNACKMCIENPDYDPCYGCPADRGGLEHYECVGCKHEDGSY